MDLISMILLAIGLSMDSLVVALTSGAILGNHKPSSVLKISGILGITQAALTALGWLVGSTFAKAIDQYDHWLAFAILTFLGGKVIYESMKKESEKPAFNPLSKRVMFSLAVATSIDATAVGLSLSLVRIPIVEPIIVIGITTFLVAAFGLVFGSKIGQRYNLQLNIFGGIILILIGCWILANHTIFAVEDNLRVLSMLGK
mgnify:CR=1 FL=1